jgi:hypothetical protein
VAPIRIAHVLNTMGLGGVRAVAHELLRRLPADRYQQFVYVLRRAGDNPEARARQVERFGALGATCASRARTPRSSPSWPSCPSGCATTRSTS